MWAAIRYRRSQALGLALLSALITACAVFAPLYESYLEQALLREGLTRYTLSDTAVTLTSVGVQGITPVPATARATFPASLGAIYDRGQEVWTGKIRHTGVAGDSTLIVRGAQETCRGLRIVTGSCPSQAFQMLVTVDEARIQGWKLGNRETAVEVTGPQSTNPLPQPFTIVGTYEQVPDPAHWLGAVLTGKAGHTVGSGDTPLMDDWVTTEATFAAGWTNGQLEVTYLLDTQAITLDGLPDIVPAVAAASVAGQRGTPAVDVQTRIGDLAAGVVEGQRQARLIVPLVMGQIGLLAVVVLGLVAASAVEQRRPELALIRLRGRGGAGAARVLLLELGTVVALGVPVGYLAAVGLSEVARRVWLTPGVAFRLPSSTVVAALVALVLAVLAVAVVARPTVREPISTLLRRVPPRRQGWAVGITDAIVIAVAVAGVASLVAGNISGPLVLATPTLLSLAVGLVLAHLLVPLAAALGRGFTRSGRVVGSLVTLQIARRPAVRRVMTIITVATAITVFATDAVVVGQRNRVERAAYEVGAEQTMTTDATQISALVAALRKADPTGRHATPVVTVQQGDASAISTFAVVPDQFAAVAQFPRDRGAFDWDAISGTPPAQASITGRRLSVTLSDIAIRPALLPPPDVPGPPGPPAPLTVDVYLAPPGGGAPYSIGLGSLPLSARGPVTLSADVSCAAGCRLTGFGLETGPGAQQLLSGKVTFGRVTTDGGPVADLGPVTGWVPSGDPDAPAQLLRDFAKPVTAAGTTSIGMEFFIQSATARIDTLASAGAVPALVVGALPPGGSGSGFQAAGLDGLSMPMSRVGTIPYAPGGGVSEAVVSLPTLARRTDQLSGIGTASVWVTDGPTAERVRDTLRSAGITAGPARSRAQAQSLLDNSASAWGLQMALVVGAAALLLAALVIVLVAAASSRSRARDYAALRLVGVSARDLRATSYGEQVVVVVVSVVAGVACGLVGARLAVPLVPFFTVPSTLFPVDATLALAPVLAASVAGLVVLVTVAAVVAGRLVRRATLDRARDAL